MSDDEGTTDYTYNKMNQLQTAGKERYEYDDNGNVISKTNSEGKVQYSYNNRDQLTLAEFEDESYVGYSYDGMGRRIYREEMSWKDFDGLKKGQEKGKGKENSNGKAKGKASCNDNAKSGNGPFNNPGQGKKLGLYKKYGENGQDHVYHKETTYLYEGLSNVLHKEYSATGSPYAEYYNGPDNQIVSRKMFGMHGLSNPAHDPALKTTGGMLYYQYDGTRAVSEVTDRHGDIIERYRYDAFGSIFTGTTTPYNYNGYTGMRYDGKSGLVDMNARWYNPGTARFMSEDTYPGDFSQTQTLNRYAYVMNNPVNQWDPTGHMAEEFVGIPDWVRAEQDMKFETDNGGSTKTYEYWWHRKTVPDPGERILVDTITEYKGIREIYQQSETTTWYYDYAKYLSFNDEYAKLITESSETFREYKNYEWDVFISAEDIAKGNQQKIRDMVGFPDNARLVSVDVSLPQAYDQFLKKELAKLVKVTQPETPKTPKPKKNWWDIGLGALQVVGGAAEAVGGAALAVFTAPTVAGALAGSYMIVDGYYSMKAGINQMRNGFIGENRYDTSHGLEEAFASLGAMTGHENLGRGTYYAVSILNPLSAAGKINSGVTISKAVTSTTKSLKAVDTATEEAQLLRLDLQTFAKNPSDLAAKGTVKHIPDIIPNKGFDNFPQLKNYLGSPGEGKAWHHIVEQSQVGKRANFPASEVNNVNNIISIPHGSGTVHSKISAHYSSKFDYTDGLTVRDWLATQSFEDQFKYGKELLEEFGDVTATSKGWVFTEFK